MYSAYLFFSLLVPIFSVPGFKNFSQNPILNMGWQIKVFCIIIFIQILIICHHYYCLGVVEHSRCIHTNILIGFHIPELQQSCNMVKILFFWMNLQANSVDGIWWKFRYTGSVTFLTGPASHFHQIIFHYRKVLAIMSPSTQFSRFSKLRPHDLDCGSC